MADALASGASVLRDVGVQVPLRPQMKSRRSDFRSAALVVCARGCGRSVVQCAARHRNSLGDSSIRIVHRGDQHVVVDDAAVARLDHRTPAVRSFAANASPSSRSTSASPVMTGAGGSPASRSVMARGDLCQRSHRPRRLRLADVSGAVLPAACRYRSDRRRAGAGPTPVLIACYGGAPSARRRSSRPRTGPAAPATAVR